MKRNLGKFLVAAAVLLLVAGFSASAAPLGKAVPITPELSKFFQDEGVNPQYLGVPASGIPKDQLAKIMAIINTPDDTTVTTDTHDVLNSLVADALGKAAVTNDSPYFIELGSTVWEAEFGLSTDTGWVPL